MSALGSNVVPFHLPAQDDEVIAGLEAVLTGLENVPPLAKSEGMSEQRISQLEARVGSVEGRLDRMESKIDRITEVLSDLRVDLASKPSTGALWLMVTSILAVALTIAFGSFAIASYVASLPS